MSDDKIIELIQINKLLKKIKSNIDNAVDELLNKHQITINNEVPKCK